MVRDGSEEQPILQVLCSKAIPNKEQERYRLLISDGTYMHSYAMIANNLNYLCREGQLGENAIFRLKRYNTSIIPNNKPEAVSITK